MVFSYPNISQLSEHFTHPNTPWSQHIQTTDLLLCVFI